MQPFVPIVNLVVLMTALSIAAERIANVVKLRKWSAPRAAKKQRERQINLTVLQVSVLLAFAIKADFFAILTHLEAPWDTLGWLGSPALASWPRFLQAAAGMMLTGAAMGFGSKFWHDVLDIVYLARSALSSRPSTR